MTSPFDSWYFSTEQTDNKCPTLQYTCKAPAACARDPVDGRRYCCDAREDNKAVCWRGAVECKTDGSTIDCGSGTSVYCCVNQKERCTKNKGQTNICWHNSRNTLNNISYAAIQDVHQSLRASQPDATTLAFDPISLIARTSPLTSSTPTSTSTSTPTAVPQLSPDNNSIAPGAIAGIVVGILAAVAIMVVGAFVFVRRRKRKAASMAALPPSYYEPKIYPNSPNVPRYELVSDYKGTELPAQSQHVANSGWGPAELPAAVNRGWAYGAESSASITPTPVSPDSYTSSPSIRNARGT